MIQVRQGEDVDVPVDLKDRTLTIHVGTPSTAPPLVDDILVDIMTSKTGGAVTTLKLNGNEANGEVLLTTTTGQVTVRLRDNLTKSLPKGEIWGKFTIKFADPVFSPDGKDKVLVRSICVVILPHE